MSTPALTPLATNRAPDDTVLIWDETRWEAVVDTWTDLPGATIDLEIGQGTASYGAIFVATFSAEALASHPNHNAVVNATVFFGNDPAAPVSANHRFVTARGNPEWSSHTLIRVAEFQPAFPTRDVTARVKVRASTGTTAGFQNWVLRVDRYNL
ncbi:hypothetical protein QWM81_25135 [Streptomyces ficellus]|uniref:Discoidin domain-containing protein n=1 Tax=Streptomyces ficellus TaxID=1977088 RepID=A0ABT7ZCU2_9ACTN|nr:hypothetical protein [Streptomyces ficellus]MDN3297265.1 hypothetical protein [Streptomyces ficellus]